MLLIAGSVSMFCMVRLSVGRSAAARGEVQQRGRSAGRVNRGGVFRNATKAGVQKESAGNLSAKCVEGKETLMIILSPPAWKAPVLYHPKSLLNPDDLSCPT